MDGEASLHVVDQTEVLAGLLDADHIWVPKKSRRQLNESCGVSNQQLIIKLKLRKLRLYLQTFKS